MNMDDSESSLLALERISFFSDAVFAIAATLLALEIRLPEAQDNSVSSAILGLLPSIAVYALSFVVIAVYWVAHHRMFRVVVGYDYALVWFNLVFLLCIAFLPAANAVLTRHYREPIAVLFYGGGLCVTSMASIALWSYVRRQSHLLVTGTQPRVFRLAILRNVGAIGVTAIAIVLAFLNTIPALLLLALYLIWDIGAAVRDGIQD
jgi:uncharacterized membrane protein